MTAAIRRIESLAAQSGGLVRASHARRIGISPATLSDLVRKGRLERLTRGVYYVTDAEPCLNPDFVTVAVKAPRVIVCLISALSYYNLTDQIPHAVDVAIAKSSRAPKLEWPPLHVYWMSEPAFSAGQTTIELDGVPVHIFSPEKTIADIFKFRNKLGTDVAVEALGEYLKRRDRDLGALWHYAEVCRVQQVMRPYLEALL